MAGMMSIMATKRVELKTVRGQFLTLDEVAAFVQDAKRAGADGAAVVKAAVSFGGKLRRVSVDVETLAHL